MATTTEGQDNDNLIEELIGQIKADNRVTRILLAEGEETKAGSGETYYPNDTADSHLILTGHDGLNGVEFSWPIRIDIRVPAKNQPRVFESPVPSEDYCAIWDGQSIVVAWSEGPDSLVAPSGGQVVADILDEAATKAGARLYVQSCEVGCEWLFVHSTIRCAKGSVDGPELAPLPQIQRGVVEIAVADLSSVAEVATQLLHEVRESLSRFGVMKTRAQRVIALEDLVRSDLTRILGYNSSRAELRRQSAFNPLSWAKRFGALRWRKTARAVMARLWLGVSAIETVKRMWHSAKFHFDAAVEHVPWLREVYANEVGPDAAAITTLEMTGIQAAVSHLAGSYDTRALVAATLAGGAIGALAGLLLTSL